MRDKNLKTRDISEILERFATVLSTRSDKTDRVIEKLASTVEQLTKAHIESKKDREFDQIRNERLEKNQRDQGKKIDLISNTVLLLDERVGTHKGKWADVTKIIVAIISAVAISHFMGKI